MLLLGAHVSTSGGVRNAPQNGEALGCTAIQIFTRNQRQWTPPPLDEEEVRAYTENLSRTGIRSVVSHDSYLINMASPDAAMRKKSINAFVDEIKRAAAFKLSGLVFHPGSHMGAGEAHGIRTFAKSLDETLDRTPGLKVPLLIESTSGQGTNLGSAFEHLRDIIAAVKTPGRFGVCLDTCHLFGAGFDLTTPETYEATMNQFDRIVGLSKIGCFHINDSKQPMASRKDRHDNIGKGLIGKKAFSLIINDPRFEKVPKILETPGGDEWYKKDLKTLRGLYKAPSPP